mgnify:CR=1 FL=1
MRKPEAKPHAREWARFLVGASRSVVAASMLRPTCLWALSCQAHMSVALDGNNCCVASFFTKPNGLHVPSPFFPLRLIHLPSLRSCPLFVIDHTDQNLALLSLLGGVWRLRDPSPTFLRRCSSTSPPASRPRPRTPWTISVTSGALALS